MPSKAKLQANETNQLQPKPVTIYYQQDLYGPHTYAYGYQVVDHLRRNQQFHVEHKYLNRTVKGSYGYLRPDGLFTVTNYTVGGKNGFLDNTWLYQQNVPVKDNNTNNNNTDESENKKFNLTEILLPVQSLNEHKDLSLNSSTLEMELLNPLVLKSLNYTAPLIAEKDSNVNDKKLKRIDNFLPHNFNLTTFQIPEKNEREDQL